MAEAIRMPLLSDTMKEGIIAAWHKKVGDKVKSDDVIADVETDKATMEVMPYVDGTLLYIGVEQGKAAKINDIIAIIGREGEDYKSLLERTQNTEEPVSSSVAPPDKEVPPKEQMPEAEAAPEATQSQTSGPQLPEGTTVVRMPLLSDTMKEGKIVAWHKQVGDIIKSDDVIADVETDKATMEVMPYADGTLLHIGVPAGSAAKINEIIAIVGKAGTDIQGFLAAGGQEQAAMPAGNETAPKPGAETEAVKDHAAAKAPETVGSNPEHEGRIKASPLAKRLAREKGIDLSQLQGTGDHGRIIKRDVDQAPKRQEAQPAEKKASVAASQEQGTEGYTDQPASQMRKVIAQRLSESMFSAPHFYLRTTITMDAAMEARKKMNDQSPVKISFNDLIIKACAMALRKHPAVNSSWMGDFIRTYQHINIGTAVAVDEGLIVPVIRHADLKGLAQISEEANILIDKARNKKLQPPEFTGNTFTISNLGMMDIDEFTAIINPPDACILAVGKIQPTPVAEDGKVVIRNLLKLTLSCDHRVVDGAVGARFMQTLKAYLEQPVTMLV